MKTKKTFLLLVFLISSLSFGQQIGNGIATGISNFNIELPSGFYEGQYATGTIDVLANDGWNHLLNLRHSNPANNNQLQIVTSYAENDRLFFRKFSRAIGSSIPIPSWHEIATRGENTFNGNQIINGRIFLSESAAAGGAISLINESKATQNAAREWTIYNMTGGYTNSLQFWSYGNNGYQGGAKMTLSDNGNIGIGTTTPTEKLEVVDGNIGAKKGSDEGPALALYNSNKTARGAIWRMYNMTGPYQDGLQFWNYPSNNWSDGKVRFVLSDNGNVGIGTATPEYKLELYTPAPNNTDAYSGINLQSENYGYLVEGGLKQGAGGILKFSLNTAGIKSEKLRIDSNGKVGIGTANPDEMLTVKGRIHAEEIIVTANVTPDYVFQKYYTGKSALKSDYIMPSLAEIENFTKKNNHLPNVPSTTEMQQKGVSLGDMSNILLQKVEELTLYAIEQQKELNRLKTENENYKLLAERLSAIEKELKKQE